jgi:membrane protein
VADEIDLRDRPEGAGGADERGRDATAPQEIPAEGWKDIATRVRAEAKQDDVTLLAAGIAFFWLLALFPALAALVSIYGLVADPSDVARHVDDLASTMPEEARQLLTEQLDTVTSSSNAGLSLGVAAGILVALWSTSAAVKHLMVALSIAYDEEETRGAVRLRAVAAGLTLLAIAVIGGSVFLLTGLPRVADSIAGDAGRWVAAVARWPVLVALMMVALAVLYRVGPDRDDPRWRWVTPGAVIATIAWVIGSIAFSVYVSNFGSYNETYGTMAAVVVTMLWLYLTALCAIVGAEINAEIEHQTARDTTVGPDRPLGARDAEMADTVGAPREAVRTRGPR